MKGNPFRGFGYLIRGFGLLTEPGLRSFVIVPLAINLVLFTLAIYLLMQQFSVLVEYCLSLMPDWLSFLDWFMWPVFAILVLISVYFSFSIVANFIAAPFNGLLAERVEQRLRGEILVDDGWQALLASVPRALHREMSKLLYQLPRFLILLLITLIPVIGFIAPVLLVFVRSLDDGNPVCDYPMDNNRVAFQIYAVT